MSNKYCKVNFIKQDSVTILEQQDCTLKYSRISNKKGILAPLTPLTLGQEELPPPLPLGTGTPAHKK